MGRIEYKYPLFKVYYSNNSNNSNIRGNPAVKLSLHLAFTPNERNIKLQIFFTEQKSSLQSTILSFPRFLNALISIWYLQILNTYRSLIRRGWGRVGTRGLLGSGGMEENEKIHWQWDEVSTNLLNCSCCWPSLEVSSVGTTISPFLWSHFFFLNFILVEKEVVSVLPSPVQMMT